MSVFTVGCDAVVEFVEKKSVFRSYSFFVTDEKQAIEKIRQVQEQKNQATHNVYAYCLREHGIERFSDAGEPQGTAGMPVLKVIHLNELVDTCIVVTRWFGGILLGAGGLVRAYTRAAALAVEASGKAEIVPAVSFLLEYGYDLHGSVSHLMESFGTRIDKQDFTDRVRMHATLPQDRFEQMQQALQSRFYGKVLLSETERFFSRSSDGQKL